MGERDGGGLPAVLVLIVVLSTLAASVAAAHLVRSRAATTDLHEAQALYAAEAGVARALARLVEEPGWRPEGQPLQGPGGARAENAPSSPRVALRAWGGLLQVTSVARRGQVEARVTSLVAQEPPGAFRAAVVSGDTLSPLTLGGRATVVGELVTGPRGWTTGSLARRPYRGAVDGPSTAVRGDPLPALDDDLFAETLGRLGRYLDRAAAEPWDDRAPALRPWKDTRVVAAERPYAGDDSVRVFVAAPGAAVTASDLRGLSGAVVVLAPGDLRIEGPLRLPPGAQVAARGRLDVVGGVEGEGVLLAGDRVRVDGPVRLQGQVLGRRALRLDGGAALAHPSVAYVAGPTAASPTFAEGDRLEVASATVDGMVLYGPGDGVPVGDGEAARLVVGPDAVVRGAVYAARRAEVSGRVEGTLLARGLYLYDSPAVYVGWLVDVAVDRGARPDPFTVPIGLGRSPAFVVVEQRSAVTRRARRAGPP